MKWYIKIEVMNLLKITVVKYRGSENTTISYFDGEEWHYIDVPDEEDTE